MENIGELNVWDIAFKFFELILVPSFLYIANKMSSLERKSDKLENILIGPDGKNGFRSRLRRLEVKVDNLIIQQASRHGEAKPPVEHYHDEDD